MNIVQYIKLFFTEIILDKFSRKLPHIFPEKKDKSIYEMSTDEFYDYLTKKPDQEEQAIIFFRFMLDYLLTAYLDGQLTSEDLDNILKMDNPYEMNRYIDRAVRSAKMQGTLLEELAKYQESGEKADDLYELILPDYAYDKKEKDLKINNLEDLKNAVKGSMTNLAEQKRLLELAKMQKAEQERLENMRREILARTPEVAELISSDGYTSTEKDEVYVSNVIEKEVDQLKKKTVVRQAKVNEGLVRNKTEAEMSPSELIAYKKRMLKKLREDMHNRGGLSARG